MKRILIAIVGVLVAGYLASPLIIGLVAKRRFPALIKANSVGDKSWTAGAFHLGYLHSSAESTLTIPVRNRAPIVVHMHHRIFQRLGPDLSVMEVTSTPTFEGNMARMVSLFYGDKPPLVIHAVIYMDGHYHATFNSPAVPSTPLPGRAGLRVRFDGMHGSETGTFHPLAAKSRLVAPGLEVESAARGVDIKLSDMMLRADLRHPQRWLQLGNVDFAIGDIRITRVTMESTDLSGLSLKFNSRREGRNLGADYVIRLASFDAPGVDFKNFVLQAGVHHVDEQGVKALAMRLAAIGRTAANRQQAAAMYLLAVRSLAAPLLAHSPQFRVKHLALDLPSGHVQAQAVAKFDGTGFSGPLNRGALRRLSVDAEAKVPKKTFAQMLAFSSREKAMAYIRENKPDLDPLQAAALTRELAGKLAAETTQNLLGRRLMLEKGDGYTSHLAVRNGQIRVNGGLVGSLLARPTP